MSLELLVIAGPDKDRSFTLNVGANRMLGRSGRPPFGGTTLVEKISRIRQTEPDKPTKFQMSIPGQFEGVVLKLLAKRPKDRYQTARDLLKELTRGQAHRHPGVRRTK